MRRQSQLVKPCSAEVFGEAAEEAVRGKAHRLTTAAPVAATPRGRIGDCTVTSLPSQALDAVDEDVVAVQVARAAELLHFSNQGVIAELSLVSTTLLGTADPHDDGMVVPMTGRAPA